ncbi:MAG: hypothetical protein LBV28_00190 [Puniceicoccales bacterium]|jgi:3-deoxy-D-manno-octulosonic-acid transferase|nr:hypothetical protein [Puniceicoccales bacterium]
MIWAYRILFLPVLLFVLPHYLLRMLRRGGYAKDFSHRFGGIGPLPKKRAEVRRIWLQAVSVGEINAVAPLLRALSARADTEVVLTTTTSTGYAIAREKLASQVLATGVFPLDFWPFSHRAWRRIQPDLVVLMEGELWPEHLRQAQRRAVPVVLINARLSDRSFRRYSRFRFVARMLFEPLARIGAATSGDAGRFAALGVAAEKIELTGNLKFDAGAVGAVAPDIVALRTALGFGDGTDAPVLLGSSTWPGEEAVLLDVLRLARERGIPLRLLLVPRHAERRGELAALLGATPWRWFLRSQHPAAAPHDADVCIADTTGELGQLTSVASLAFIGKSLPPHDGGQTPIECAARGVSMVYGPHMSNFRDACKGLEAADAAVRATDAGAVVAALLALLENPSRRANLAANARRWHTENQGATERTSKLLEVRTKS